MKLLAILVTTSIVFNVYVLWRLEQPSREAAATYHAPQLTPQATATSPCGDSSNQDLVAPLRMQIAELGVRLEKLEERYEGAGAAHESALDNTERYARAKKVVESFNREGNSAGDEEWFWTTGGEGETSLSFSPTDGLTVNSVVCRSDWCRVELEDTSSEGEDLISDLELQLKINESLGRDTVIRSGKRNDSHRVLFVQ